MKSEEIAREISARYRQRWLRAYVQSKISTDPAYRLAAQRLANVRAPLIDVGCGSGVFAYYLRAAGFEENIIGVDRDERKIAGAEKARRPDDSGITFFTGTIDDVGHFSGSVALIDVLHYLSPSEQKVLLGKAATMVAPEGLLLIRDALAGGGWRSLVTSIEETLAIATGWLRGGSLHFPSEAFLRDHLGAEFDLELLPAYGRTPFNNYLIVGRRRV